jgi:Family of unknown function (DUF5681)
MSDNSYNVGYGKPPKHRRFRKGVSGNRKGRPKGKCNVATVLERILQEKIVLCENGKERIVTKLEAAVEQLVNKAASGDLIALRHLIALKHPADQTLEAAGKTPSDTDLIVMKTVLTRFKHMESENDKDE